MKNPSWAVKAQNVRGCERGRFNGIFNSMHDKKLTRFLNTKKYFHVLEAFLCFSRKEKRHLRNFRFYSTRKAKKRRKKEKL